MKIQIYHIKKIVITSVTIALFISIITAIFWNHSFSEVFSFKWFGINLMYSFVLTLLNSSYFGYINNNYNWEGKGAQRLIVGATGSIVLTMLGFAFCKYITEVHILQTKNLNEFIAAQRISNYLFPLLFTIIVSLFFHAIYFYKALQEKKVTEQKIIAGTASAQFSALKNQLDPHFLFNSLNVLTSLIDENPKMAQKFTTSLSKVYRYVLEQKSKELVTVDEELTFARTYMTLLKLRFEDSILFEIPENVSNPEAKVVPLSLQILLENTVKHNVVMPSKPLHIRIYEDNGYLIVENNLQPKQVIQQQRSGVGLVNIKQRYGLLTKRTFEIFKTETAFIAKLPILTKQLTYKTMTTLQNKELVEDLKYSRAKEQVKKMKEFYGNLFAYCIVIPFLIFVNYFTTGLRFPWVLFPILGWGLGLIFHYSEAFNWHPFLSKNWEKRKISQYMNESNTQSYE